MKRTVLILLWAVVLALVAWGGPVQAQSGEDGGGGKEGEEKTPADPPPNPDTKPEAKPEPESKPAPEPDPEPKAKSQPESKTEPGPGPKPAPAPKPEPEEEGEAWKFAPKIHGSFTARYRVRYSEYDDLDTGELWKESDQDLTLLLNLSVKNLYKEHLHFHMLGGFNIDTWGRQDSKHRPEVFEFADIYDTFDHKAKGNLHYAYLELDDLPKGLNVKGGRQHLTKGEPVHFDGLSLAYRSPCKAMGLTAFFGLPVYFWKAHMLGNLVGGGYVEFWPFEVIKDMPGDTTKLTVEYIWVQEDSDEEGIEDSFFSFVLDQKLFNRTVDLQARASVLNGEFRDFKVRGTLREKENDIRLRIQYYSMPVKQEEELSIDLSPYLQVMGRYNPFNEFRLDVYKGFDDKFALELGYHGRMLKKERYEGKFNHDFDRLYITGYAFGFLESNLDISATVEYVQSMGPVDEEGILTAGFDLTYRFNDQLKIGISTHFHRWEMKYLGTQQILEEIENVRVHSLSINFRPVPDLRIALRYSFETVGGDLEREYDRLLLTATYSF
jgi:hypothetical protein